VTDVSSLVSVVTPFHNTAEYIGVCIESVLAQTHDTLEYLLVDNKSTDGSREIAERYARRDSRIRLLENDFFLEQLENYNGALARISPDSKYVKIAQADDVLFPECIARMVSVAEHEPTVGIVSSYYLYGRYLEGAGVPYTMTRVRGRDACRQILRTRHSLTGSQTTVLYRADLVRSRRPFFTPGRYHADTETAFEILLRHDLGYVHQVLSFSRADNPGITTSASDFNPLLLHYYMMVERYGSEVLAAAEFREVRAEIRRDYYEYLGRMALRRRDGAFWSYHQRGLASLGLTLSRSALAKGIAVEVVRVALNPQHTAVRLRRKIAARTGAQHGVIVEPPSDAVATTAPHA
jgi:glycosyltransferase involved in cell wall biosynthesis